MGSFLQKLADEMRGSFKAAGMGSGVTLFSEKEKDAMARYQKAFDEKESFEVVFELSESDGSLVCKDQHGIKIVMDGEYLKKDLPYYEESNKAHFIGTDFVVKVIKIDEAEGVVYVRSAYHNSQSTRQRIVREILSELNRKDRKEDEYLVLPGRIINVTEKRAMVDILGKGILGIITSEQWQNGYVRHLPKVVSKGEVYDFVIVKQKANTTGRHRSLAFELTRRPITEDPWTLIKKNNPGLEAGSVIAVKCVNKPAGRSYWWGISPLVQGIEIMGDYSTSVARPYVGVTYKCRIKRLDPENHKFQVVPFDIIDTPGGSKEAVKFISERPKRSRGVKKED